MGSSSRWRQTPAGEVEKQLGKSLCYCWTRGFVMMRLDNTLYYLRVIEKLYDKTEVSSKWQNFLKKSFEREKE